MDVTRTRKLLLIGLDAVPSNLLFDDLLGILPNFQSLIQKGIHGTLKSCHPPITVPAWTVMMSGLDPGTLGIYGFRHRRGTSYTDPWIVSSKSIKHERIWEILERYGKKSVVIGVPPAYPPYRIHGKLISCFLAPDNADQYTYPKQLKNEIEKIAPDYKFDVVFRIQDKESLLRHIYDMTKKRFEVIKNWICLGDWDFFMSMEIGTDRLHHAFWKFYDKAHPKYIAGNEYEAVIPEYYKYLDREIGQVLKLVDENTIVMIVSDHGTKSMKGAFCINEWLINEGYLVLKSYPTSITDIEKVQVDWEKTTAWGWGGYYARVFLNKEGRESSGIVKEDDYQRVLGELKMKLQEVKDPTGRNMDTFIFEPDQMYAHATGDKPDLMVYFDDLYWRSAGTIGHNAIYLSENDTGPDDSVHSMDGVFILYDPGLNKPQVACTTRSIYDIAPTILNLFNIDILPEMHGTPIKI